MSLLDEITLDDLDAEQRELAECIGITAYKALVERYAGETINIRMPDRLTIGIRNKRITDDFNGYNFKELSRKYGLCERAIRYIVSEVSKEIRNRPLPDQVSFFDSE